jgi:hypothetical protein
VPNQRSQHQQKHAKQNAREEVRRLRREVANLKSLVSQRQPDLNNANAEGTIRAKLDSTPTISSRTASDTADHQSDISRNASSFSHPKDRSPQGYYAKHSLFKFFTEVEVDFRIPTDANHSHSHSLFRSHNSSLSSLKSPMNGFVQLV